MGESSANSEGLRSDFETLDRCEVHMLLLRYDAGALPHTLAQATHQ